MAAVWVGIVIWTPVCTDYWITGSRC